MVIEIVFALILLGLLVVVPRRRGRAVLALVLVVGGMLNLFPGLIYPFRADDWRAAGKFRRRMMTYDFLSRVPVVGKSRTEIEALLGKERAEHDIWKYTLGGIDESRDKNPNAGAKAELMIGFENNVVSKVYISDGWKPPETRIPFDEAQWRTSGADIRSQMVADLFRGPFVTSVTGAGKQVLIERLGPPNSRMEAKELEYDLGVFPWLGEIRGLSLVFLLSENDTVLSGSVIRHPRPNI